MNDLLASPRPLRLIFQKNGWDYIQLSRTERTAIYEQRAAGGKLFAYEVVVIRVRKPLHFPDRSAQNASGPEFGVECQPVPAAAPSAEIGLWEQYPSDSDWGVMGWTYSLYGGKVTAEAALAEANAKVDELIAAQVA
jgi:hypothetical protein